MKSPAAQALAAMRKTEQKTCPECGIARTALVRANSTCRKCRDRLRKRADAKVCTANNSRS